MNKEILKDLKILYVEDEDDVREFTGKILKTVVQEVILAENGKVGVEKFHEYENFDLIVTDINMPKMNGFDMCAKIKETAPNIPIVVTSAHNDPDFLRQAIEIGVNAYAMKPIDLYQLLDNIIMAVEPFYLKKKLEEANMSLTLKVEEGIKQIKSILDAQDNLVIVTDGTNILNVNKKFLEFFNLKSINESGCISDYFIQEEGFFCIENMEGSDLSWFEYMIHNLNEIDRIVKINNAKKQPRIFKINIDNYEEKDEYYVISLTDITEIKEKSNLLEYQATHDTLTGLFNRQKFHDIFAKEVRRDKRYQNDLSIIMFDIDFFKKINDEFGHLIGDEVLIDISKLVLTIIREHDTMVRWGGEEFVILLPETNLNGAIYVAEKIRENISAYNHKQVNQSITASFGVTVLKEKDTEENIIRRADEALYQAKENGRDQVASS
jgi:diguanylate cyclase (GGDEF)-like protein